MMLQEQSDHGTNWMVLWEALTVIPHSRPDEPALHCVCVSRGLAWKASTASRTVREKDIKVTSDKPVHATLARAAFVLSVLYKIHLPGDFFVFLYMTVPLVPDCASCLAIIVPDEQNNAMASHRSAVIDTAHGKLTQCCHSLPLCQGRAKMGCVGEVCGKSICTCMHL